MEDYCRGILSGILGGAPILRTALCGHVSEFKVEGYVNTFFPSPIILHMQILVHSG